MKVEKKFLSFSFDTKATFIDEERNIGVIKGYASTFDLDRGGDIVARHAFDKTLADHQQRKRQIRMCWQHDSHELIGGFPPEKAYVDDNGLFVEGEVNLETQRGREAFALAKQGVLSDFSIGYRVHDWEYKTVKGYDVRILKEIELFEISTVGEPMNPYANFTEVKSAVPYQDLPLATREREWDSDSAIGRVRELLDSMEEPSESYRRAFLWYDADNAENFAAYKLPIADVIDGTLTAVPRAIFAAAAALSGARGGVDIPENERAPVIANVERYYAKMDLESPFSEKSSFRLDDLSVLTERDLEKMFKSGVSFTNSTAKRLASALKSFLRDEEKSGNRDDSKQVVDSQFADELKALAEYTKALASKLEGKKP